MTQPLPPPDLLPDPLTNTLSDPGLRPEPGPPGAPVTLALVGPTAAGKTDLALALAEALDLAVLSVDSRQLYRGMDIGTAKPTAAQRARVRHELLDLRDPDQPINLQEFTALALEAIAAEHRRRGVALLVGGSGLYLEALLRGLRPPAVPPQPWLRAQLESLGQPFCHGLLLQADPVAAARIAPADAVRTHRALEVLYGSGQPISSQQGRQPPPWRILELGLLPANLGERIRLRSRAMFDQGLEQETVTLRARYGAHCPLLATMGYAEAGLLLEGRIGREAAIARTEQRTRQYAKRQRTWFRRRHAVHWLGREQPLLAGLPSVAPSGSLADPPTEPEGEAGDLLRQAMQLTEQVLG